MHRKQIDVCYACGRVGHRIDVCPDPSNKICRGCGISNPAEDHECVPKCGLCGGKHLTADKACKARFKTPYVVRRRRWERRRAEEEEDAGRRNREKRGPAGGPHRSASKQRGRSQTPVRSSNNSSGENDRQSRSRSKSRSRGGNGGGNRRWETVNPCSSGRSGSPTTSRSKSRAASGSRASSRHRTSSSYRASLKSRNE